VNQEESEQNEVDGMKKGDDLTGYLSLTIAKSVKVIKVISSYRLHNLM